MQKIIKLLSVLLTLLFITSIAGCTSNNSAKINDKVIDRISVNGQTYYAVYIYKVKEIQTINKENQIIDANKDDSYFVCIDSIRYDLKTENNELYYENTSSQYNSDQKIILKEETVFSPTFNVKDEIITFSHYYSRKFLYLTRDPGFLLFSKEEFEEAKNEMYVMTESIPLNQNYFHVEYAH